MKRRLLRAFFYAATRVLRCVENRVVYPLRRPLIDRGIPFCVDRYDAGTWRRKRCVNNGGLLRLVLGRIFPERARKVARETPAEEEDLRRRNGVFYVFRYFRHRNTPLWLVSKDPAGCRVADAPKFVRFLSGSIGGVDVTARVRRLCVDDPGAFSKRELMMLCGRREGERDEEIVLYPRKFETKRSNVPDARKTVYTWL